MSSSSAPFSRLTRHAALLTCAVTLAASLAVASRPVAAQDVYGPSDLSSLPKLVSPAATARLIARSYSPELRRSRAAGTVQLEFVIDRDGKVESGSIIVVGSPVPTLGSAAKAVVEKLEFVPGKKDGQAVRARVQLPIEYKP